MAARTFGCIMVLLQCIYCYNLEGNISLSLNLTIDNSPYNVTGDITIQDGATLFIENGVEIIFNSNYKINVYGSINSGCYTFNTSSITNKKGLADNNTFVYIHDATKSSYDSDIDGGGIWIYDASSTFCNTLIENMYYGIRRTTESQTPYTIDNCEFNNIYSILWQSQLLNKFILNTITDTHIHHITQNIKYEEVMLDNCLLEDFSAISPTHNIAVRNCVIYGTSTSQSCIYIEWHTHLVAKVFYNNFISDCGIYIDDNVNNDGLVLINNTFLNGAIITRKPNIIINNNTFYSSSFKTEYLGSTVSGTVIGYNQFENSIIDISNVMDIQIVNNDFFDGARIDLNGCNDINISYNNMKNDKVIELYNCRYINIEHNLFTYNVDVAVIFSKTWITNSQNMIMLDGVSGDNYIQYNQFIDSKLDGILALFSLIVINGSSYVRYNQFYNNTPQSTLMYIGCYEIQCENATVQITMNEFVDNNIMRRDNVMLIESSGMSQLNITSNIFTRNNINGESFGLLSSKYDGIVYIDGNNFVDNELYIGDVNNLIYLEFNNDVYIKNNLFQNVIPGYYKVINYLSLNATTTNAIIERNTFKYEYNDSIHSYIYLNDVTGAAHINDNNLEYSAFIQYYIILHSRVDVDATFNYFGILNIISIFDKIDDICHDSQYGSVSFSPFYLYPIDYADMNNPPDICSVNISNCTLPTNEYCTTTAEPTQYFSTTSNATIDITLIVSTVIDAIATTFDVAVSDDKSKLDTMDIGLIIAGFLLFCMIVTVSIIIAKWKKQRVRDEVEDDNEFINNDNGEQKVELVPGQNEESLSVVGHVQITDSGQGNGQKQEIGEIEMNEERLSVIGHVQVTDRGQDKYEE